MLSFEVPSTVKHAIDEVPHTREHPFRHRQLLKSSHQLAELTQDGGMVSMVLNEPSKPWAILARTQHDIRAIVLHEKNEGGCSYP
jgi:hypothetical protein